jgi:hypothetical protein
MIFERSGRTLPLGVRKTPEVKPSSPDGVLEGPR